MFEEDCASLYGLHPDIENPKYDLSWTETKIGRSIEECEVVVKNRKHVSRVHVIIRREGRYKLENKGTNGTYINGKFLEDRFYDLKDGDTIGLGDPEALIRFVDSSPTQPVLPPRRIQFDNNQKKFLLDKKTLDLTPIEAKLLKAFSDHYGKVLSRKELADAIWGKSWVSGDEDDTLNKYILRLREKMKQVTLEGDLLIKNERGIGFRLVDMPKM